MTREEAIKQLKKLKSFHNGSYGEAINFAIESIKVDIAYDLAYEKTDIQSSKQETQWIPVNEELPEVSVSVIGITAFDDICIADLYDFCGKKEWYANGCYDVPIVAWMPLPQPYKESEG